MNILNFKVPPDDTPSEVPTGGTLKFKIFIQDNFEVDRVNIEYSYGEKENFTINLSYSMESFFGTISISETKLDWIYYRIHAYDAAGNHLSTVEKVVVTFDSINPYIAPMDEYEFYIGHNGRISVFTSDNVGVTSYYLDNVSIDVENGTFEFLPTELGEFELPLTVYDDFGNSYTGVLKIIVFSANHDRDNDGIPDIFEIQNELDYENPNDAGWDMDDDGLTNLEEYLHNTNITNDDSDDDGMPDGWEVMHFLDPTRYSANDDSDEDGFTDLEEFQKGTNPQNEEKSNDETTSVWMILLFIILIGILISIIIAMFIRKNRGSHNIESEENELKEFLDDFEE
jgi:hypothetical protein